VEKTNGTKNRYGKEKEAKSLASVLNAEEELKRRVFNKIIGGKIFEILVGPESVKE